MCLKKGSFGLEVARSGRLWNPNKNKKGKIMNFQIAESEILAVAGLCMNDFKDEKKDILLINADNLELFKMLLKFGANIYALNANVERENLAGVAFYDLAINLKITQFDAIIDLKSKGVEHYKKLLKPNGILIVDLDAMERAKIADKRADFNVLMPFRLQFGGCEKNYLFASSKFHPIADFSLQKLDMMDGLQYCNARIYEAAFALPNYVRWKLKGVIRN